jgi:hypothetical protein
MTPEIVELVQWLARVLDEIELGARDFELRGHHAGHVFNQVDAYRRLMSWAVTWLERGVAPWNADALRILASGFSQMPGYKEEWRL